MARDRVGVIGSARRWRTGVNSYWEYWYEIINHDTLRQGDIFRDLIVFAFPQDLPIPQDGQVPDPQLDVKAELYRGSWIVMSASCDLERGSKSYPWVIVGRVERASPDTLKTPGKFEDALEVIKRGLEPQAFLLAECPNVDPPFVQSYVTFRPHLTVPIDYLRRACSVPRLRLRPPHREEFGNWVGANISRIGIEVYAQIPRVKGTVTASKRLITSDVLQAGVAPVPKPESSAWQTTASKLGRWLRNSWSGLKRISRR